MHKATAYSLALGFLLLTGPANALEFGKPIQATILTHSASSSKTMNAAVKEGKLRQTVTLMNIKLSSKQKQLLQQYNGESSNSEPREPGTSLPRHADIGMNGVPVLDQGQYGACVTFAVTGAIDALLGKGDYISQLCNLELGSYFEEKGYLPSGWNGSIGPLVLSQMLGFGVINKDKQRSVSCGGLKDYPLSNSSETGKPLSLDDYKTMSENIGENLYWDSILTFYQRFENPGRVDQLADSVLFEIKKILAQRPYYMETRLTFASLIPVEYCSAGACARFHADEDTWALTRAIKQDPDPSMGGHEMIIIGYDDDAIATDPEGTQHRGLLHLRNSWGTRAGDQGDYYMTYDFFKKYVMAVEKVVLLKY